MIAQVFLPGLLQDHIEKEARDAFPRECCGLVEGVGDEQVLRVTAVHPARNLATEPDRFEIDPADQFRVLRALRGTGRDIIGCYHSHPNGRAQPSARDREGAFGGDFLWLILALVQGQDGLAATLGAFTIGTAAICEVPIAPGIIAAV
jgi:proteasome lid subunit RPN8/RPN11